MKREQLEALLHDCYLAQGQCAAAIEEQSTMQAALNEVAEALVIRLAAVEVLAAAIRDAQDVLDKSKAVQAVAERTHAEAQNAQHNVALSLLREMAALHRYAVSLREAAAALDAADDTDPADWWRNN